MTSVPKPLKFLRAHYEGLKTQYSSLPASNANRPALADVLSVLAITSGKEGERESLHYRWGLTCPCVSCTLPMRSGARTVQLAAGKCALHRWGASYAPARSMPFSLAWA